MMRLLLAGLVAVGCATAAVAGDERGDTIAAGIEIGTNTVRGTVVKLDRTPWDTDRVAVKWEKTVQSTLGVGMKETGTLAAKDIADAADKVKMMADAVGKEFAIPADRVYVVVAASLSAAGGVDDLTAAVGKATGKTPELLTPEKEIWHGMGVMPEQYKKKAIYADVGAGGVRFGTYIPGTDTSMEEFRFDMLPGVTAFQKAATERAKADGSTFADAAKKEADVLAAKLKKEVAERDPALVNREHLLVTGGAAWATAALGVPEEADAAYVLITPDAVNRLLLQLRETPDKLPKADTAGIRFEAVKAAAAAEAKEVENKFTPERLHCSLEVLRAMSEAFAFKHKKVYFPREKGQGWLAGYTAAKLTDRTTAKK